MRKQEKKRTSNRKNKKGIKNPAQLAAGQGLVSDALSIYDLRTSSQGHDGRSRHRPDRQLGSP